MGANKTTGKKKTATGGGAKKASVKRATGKKNKATAAKSGGNAPLVLIIMALVTAIVFLLLGRSERRADFAEEEGRTVEIIKPAGERGEGSKTAKTAEDKAAKKQSEEEKRAEEKKQADKKKRSEEKKAASKTEAKDKVVTDAQNKEYAAVGIWLYKLDEAANKLSLVQVRRRVEGGASIKAALDALAAGPTAGEQKKNYLSALPAGLKPNGVRISGRIAEIDFPESLGSGASGTILMNRIDQIVYTATQFSDIDGVVITINGQRRSTIGSDGLSIQGPLHRRAQ